MDISDILTHHGEEHSNYFNAMAPPIIQSSNFIFNSIEDLKHKISNEFHHHVYSRGNNPTVEILRKKVAALEHAEDALIVGSGATAVSLSIIANVSSGDHVICVNKPYSWTNKLISKLLPRLGVSYTFVDAESEEELKEAIKPNTKVIMLESPNTLTFEIQDLQACADIARAHNITTVIDNSHSSPIFQNPIDFGIDIVIHSATKYICGHSDVVMGVICSNHKMIEKIFHSEFMTFGTIVSPNDAFLAIRGLRTLPLRVQRSDESCKKIFNYLNQSQKIRKIHYVLDPEHPSKNLINKQMRGNGGLITIELDTESKEIVNSFVNNLDKFLMAVSWGGYESLKMPTLAFYDIPGQANPTIHFSTIRLYIGLEDADFLIENLDKALKSV